MTLKQIKDLEKSYWNIKTKDSARDAREAKAVMFGENIRVLFDCYRISEGDSELTRRVELAKPSNQEDFETVISYISNYFDLDSVELNMTEPIFNWLSENDLEEFFTDTVLPSMIASPNSYVTLIPKQIGNDIEMDIEVIDLDRIIYADNDNLIYRVETDIEKPLYSDYIPSDYIILNKQGGFLYTSQGDLISQILFNEDVNVKYWFKLGGLKRLNHRGFYSSYFKGSINKSITATRIFSDMELIRMRVGNPITIMKQLPCTSCGGADSSCGTCKGTNKVDLKPSMGSVYYWSEFDINKENSADLDNVIKFIQPPLDSVRIQREQYDLHNQEVKEGLNNFYYKHSQSGVAKEIDREDKVASTEVILYRLFTIASDILNAYSQIVTIEKQPVTIVIPNELVGDTSAPTAVSGISANELADRTLNYYRSKYKDDPVSLRLYTYAVMNDILFPYTALEKIGIGTQEQVSYSNQLSLAIMKVRSKYNDRVRTATDKTIEKWLSEFITDDTQTENNNTNTVDILVTE